MIQLPPHTFKWISACDRLSTSESRVITTTGHKAHPQARSDVCVNHHQCLFGHYQFVIYPVEKNQLKSALKGTPYFKRSWFDITHKRQ